jgi:hypothetical protein
MTTDEDNVESGLQRTILNLWVGVRKNPCPGDGDLRLEVYQQQEEKSSSLLKSIFRVLVVGNLSWKRKWMGKNLVV